MQIESYIFSKPEIIKSLSCQVAKNDSSVFELNKLRAVSTTFKNVIDKEEALLYNQIWYGNALACKKACKNHLIIESLFNDLQKPFELEECSEYDIKDVSKELAITRERLKEEKAQFTFFTISFDDYDILDRIHRTNSTFQGVTKSLDDLQVDFKKCGLSYNGTFSTGMFISPTACFGFLSYNKQGNSLEFTKKLKRITKYKEEDCTRKLGIYQLV